MTDAARTIPHLARMLAPLLVATIVVPACADEASAPAPAAKVEATAKPAAPPTTIESTAILARTTVAEAAEVKHVLIGWAELAPAYGGRMPDTAKARSKADADKLATDVLARATAGEDFVGLMKTYSEDWGSAATGTSYPVTPTAGLVPPFKDLSLRLKLDESGLVLTNYGWHIIKRVK